MDKSKIGSANATKAATILNSVKLFWEVCVLVSARMTPRNKLPVSPKKMEAGFQLKRRNPRVAPTMQISSKAPTTLPST